MPFYLYLWDGENDRHIAGHGITQEEFEEVVGSPDEITESRSSGRPAALGQTATGRYLICIYEMIDDVTVYPITAYELSQESTMVDREDRRITAPLTEEARRRYAESRDRIGEIREKVDADLPGLIATARRAKAAHDEAQTSTREAAAQLKSERELKGVSLAEVADRTGIPAEELRRLEEGRAIGNLGVLSRYAAALGKRFSVTLSGPA